MTETKLDAKQVENAILQDIVDAKAEMKKKMTKLPEGISEERFFDRIRLHSSFKNYIVDTEDAKALADKGSYIVNQGIVRIKKELEMEPMLDNPAITNITLDQALTVFQRDLQISLAKELDEYLTANAGVKLAKALFINPTALKYSTYTVMDPNTFQPLISCNFILNFDMYIG